MYAHQPLVRFFHELDNTKVGEVGGKNASLGEMVKNLSDKGIQVPDGFATTAAAYWDFLDSANIRDAIADLLGGLDKKAFTNLKTTGRQIRRLILDTPLPAHIQQAIRESYRQLKTIYGDHLSLAVRSSANAEDLPHASFAGQQETYLNIQGEAQLMNACHRCYASLFTDRAIQYREYNNFDHMEVALSIGVQVMVRSDKASSGVIFTIDPDTGFDQIVLVSGAWGLGENVVQGTVNADEFLVFKPFLATAAESVIAHTLGSKAQTMVYATGSVTELSDAPTVNIPTPEAKQNQLVLSDPEIRQLAEWAVIIEAHYGHAMDIEWAKDGETGQLFIVQARPETVYSPKKTMQAIKHYRLKNESEVLCQGIGLGKQVTKGKARVLESPEESDKLQAGEVLVTSRTDPDWDPVMKKAAAIITDHGGRTSHAAIVAREIGAVAVVGTGNATQVIEDGMEVTVSSLSSKAGLVYKGLLEWEEETVDTNQMPMPKTQPMLILGDPDHAFRYAFYPNQGVGLARLEFIINNTIGIHPMALRYFDDLSDEPVKKVIQQRTKHYANKAEFFIQELTEAVAKMAVAFYPRDVIVRMSDFKTNEYANLIGGQGFEPREANPMLGFRGASRYYHSRYREGFAMECQAMKRVRDEMGLTNVKLMIPFCRTIREAEKVQEVMESQGLKRGENGLELYMMVEVPSNVVLADQFARYFDGFSIGSNDLTQLVLGVDRDSDVLSEIFDPHDQAFQQMVAQVISSANQTGTKIGLCGQAPSDYPEIARFLVAAGINSISFNPDALLQGIQNINAAESE